MATTQAAADRTSSKALSRLDATALVVGLHDRLRDLHRLGRHPAGQVHAPGVLLLVWALSGVVTLMGALSYGELAAMFPRAGGQYVYLREGISPLFGYLYGWTLFLVIQTGTIAAVAVAFARFTACSSRPSPRMSSSARRSTWAAARSRWDSPRSGSSRSSR